MHDLELLLGFSLCFGLPLAGAAIVLGALVLALRPRRDLDLERRVADLEAEVVRLRGERATVLTALSHPAPATLAPEPVPVPVVVSEPVPEPAPEPASAPPPALAPAPADSWERFLGVRAAAAAGASLLVLAGLYLFQYSIEHGWIGPALRVALAGVVGIACVLASEWPLRARHPSLSGWLAGAGIAILYITSWAASALYQLVPAAASGTLMVAVTAACATLSARRSSLPIALLGLAGGFLTPLALGARGDQPIPLFAYLLLLDAGLLFVAHRKRWPLLALLAFAATAIHQLVWTFAHLGAGTVVLGVLVVLGFTALFLAVPAPRGESSSGWTRLLRVSAVLHPFLLALAFVRVPSAPLALGSTAALLVTLAIGGAVAARRRGLSWLALLAAAGATAVWAIGMLSWPLGSLTESAAPLAIALAVALVFHVSAELDRGARVELASASSLASLAPLAVITIVALARTTAWLPLALASLVMVALALRVATLPGRAALALPASVLAPIATLAVAYAARDSAPPALVLALFALQALPFQIAASLAAAPARRVLDVAAAIAALLGALVLAAAPGSALVAGLAASLACALLALFAASRAGGAWIAGATVVVTAIVQARFAFPDAPAEVDAQRLALLGASTITLSLWPSLAPRLSRAPWGWRAAALAAPLSFLSLRHLWLEVLGERFAGGLAILCALLSLGVALGARARSLEPETRRVAMVWLLSVSAGFVTLAIPLQLDREQWTIAWALEGAALLALDRRLDHAGVRYLAMALFGAVAARLLLNPYLLDYHPRGALRVVNWLSYTYLVPALALLAGSRALADLELARRRAWERSILPERPVLAPLLFATCLVVVFVWLNLTIVDWFASGPMLALPVDRLPARDLAMSIAWAAYALGLLALGVLRSSTGLRAASLALLVVTCGKVFLYDLGHLRDLHRVASIAGLALSLILVSLAYQRFVFRRRAPEVA